MEALARVFHQGPGRVREQGTHHDRLLYRSPSPSRTTTAVDDESDQERRNDELENRRGACVLGKPL